MTLLHVLAAARLWTAIAPATAVAQGFPNKPVRFIVPFAPGGQSDLVGGQIAFMFASPLEVMPHVKAGKLNVLGVTSAKRVSYWPDVPTLKEAGYKEYEAHA